MILLSVVSTVRPFGKRSNKPVAILTARKIADALNTELSDLLAEKDPDEVTYQ